MGISQKSHSKQSDKETQSPILKVFKDIMQRENNDTEKANLIKKEKQDKRKRKTYSGSHQKCDRRSCESSSTDRYKRSQETKMAVQELQQQLYKDQYQETQRTPYHSEKKDSWWFWKEPQKKKKSDDTYSCVSCALKKIISSEYVCIACLVLVFTLSIVAAFFVVFRNATTPGCIAEETQSQSSETAKKSDLMKARRQFRSEGANFNGLSYTERNYPDESGSRLSGTLSHILDPEKMTDSQTSEKLRDFYNRLIQTDARIKKLKKETEESNVYSSAGDISMKPISDKYKRSLMSINSPSYSPPQRRESGYSDIIDLSKFNLYYPPFAAVREYNEPSRTPTRIKRAKGEIYDDEPSGIVIEKKKVMVQYGPLDRKRNFPKCSHTPKESKSHEKQLKHPFYKSSQRLDELLDQLLEKNMDKIIANPFELDVLVSNRDKCKHPKQEETINTKNKQEEAITTKNKQEEAITTKNKQEEAITTKNKPKEEITTKNKQEVQKKVSARATKTPVFETNTMSAEFKRMSIGSDSKSGLIDKEPQYKDEYKEGYGYSLLSTTPLYDIVLSVSTLINSESTESINVLTDNAEIHQSKRKLLQFNEEDDDNLGYEDFKEVLSDYMDTHDETDKQVERDRRSDKLVIPNEQKSSEKDIPSIHNPNWKGPMPLYPDELNLIKHAVVQNPKNEISEDVKEMLAQKDKLDSQITDKEYIEDYFNNKYDKLAQAYSDYGVLAEKKESVTNEKNLATESKVLDHKMVAIPGKDEIIKNLSFKGKNNAKLRRY
ncbi:unnamed protein product [Parnassius mnemosyne]|uniref:Uncharacterized protein n=1 Tax=Parnassius mnemosyne TaxID=213953 RepID=A0AAV1LHL2_9NEOP